MYNQYISLKGKLTQSPVFNENTNGSKFTEINLIHTHKFTDRNGAVIEINTPFTLILNENLGDKVKRYQKDDLIEVSGDYLQDKSGGKFIHLIFADAIDRVKDIQKSNLKITVKGNLTQTPELKESKTGNQYFKIAIATNAKLPNEEENFLLTTFFNLLFTGDVVETNKNLIKGKYIQVDGNLELKPYQSKDGGSRIDNTIYVKEVSEIEYSPQDNILTSDPRFILEKIEET